jgi:hypothetical protein
MEEERKFEPVNPGDISLEFLGGEYVQVEAGEPIKAHVWDVEKTMGTNFNTKEPEEKLAVQFELDEGEGKGQRYSCWMGKAITERTTVGKLITACFGSLDAAPRNELGQFDPAVFKGQPLRVYLTKGKDVNGKLRQYVDTKEKPFSGPTKDQTPGEYKTDETVDPIQSAVNEIFSK